MTLILSGTDGLSDVDGSAATPAIRGTDANTGIFFPAADTIAFSEGGTEAMRLDSSGNVGIGTSSPISKLTVLGAGTINAPETTTTGGSIQTASYGITTRTGNLELGATDALAANIGGSLTFSARYTSTNATWVTGKIAGYRETATGGVASSYLAFATTTGAGDLTERARIDSSGNLLVGTTTMQSNPGGAAVNAIFNSGIVVGGSGGGVRSALTYDRINFSTTQFYVLNESNSGVVLTNGSTAWASQSDERTKNIIEPINDAVHKVSSLRAVIGKYKTDEDGVRRSFLIAQDVQAVLPEAVSASDDDQGTLNLRYSEIIPLLVAAIKEQQAIIQSLTARITALESN